MTAATSKKGPDICRPLKSVALRVLTINSTQSPALPDPSLLHLKHIRGLPQSDPTRVEKRIKESNWWLSLCLQMPFLSKIYCTKCYELVVDLRVKDFPLFLVGCFWRYCIGRRVYICHDWTGAWGWDHNRSNMLWRLKWETDTQNMLMFRFNNWGEHSLGPTIYLWGVEGQHHQALPPLLSEIGQGFVEVAAEAAGLH